ncbi:hypothetical protein INP83_03135 [Mucilaginibacter sp. 21P]|uniref:hypothetical protein n=1 Tax=Mucilaginibacter sp. 21P TaxID=2778902 RepID=UPI001C57F14F|nr:hypothetical protein [Mucilaginibacter sp. 21P]QXV66102.1 hypothetical protein INP83_03135 [Mucilaginibacter sp. 21P]
MNKQRVLTDSGFWIALYEPEKEAERSELVSDIIDMIADADICIPWPTMYEFVNSRLGRRKDRLNQFKKILENPNTFKIDDAPYKNIAIEKLFGFNRGYIGDISLVDEVIKGILTDTSLNINYFVSFDEALANFARSQGINVDLNR